MGVQRAKPLACGGAGGGSCKPPACRRPRRPPEILISSNQSQEQQDLKNPYFDTTPANGYPNRDTLQFIITHTIMSIIETNDLKKIYHSRGRTVEAVRSVTMSVATGEIFGFLGPNGAGKTTTMRMLTTLIDPSGGHALVAGFDLMLQPDQVRKNIGYVSQAGGTERSATTRENLVLQAQLYGMSKSDAYKRAEELIHALDMEAFADRVADTYSGGQRRRVDLALGMVHKPKLLFLDEPTTGLDPQSRARLWEEITRLRNQNGTTVFITTHYLDEADALCDRLAIIDHGTIVAQGTPATLKRQIAGDVITVGLGESNTLGKAQQLLETQSFVRAFNIDKDNVRLYVEHGEQALPNVLRILDTAQIAIKTISLNRPTLDDVFLKQTGRSLRETNL